MSYEDKCEQVTVMVELHVTTLNIVTRQNSKIQAKAKLSGRPANICCKGTGPVQLILATLPLSLKSEHSPLDRYGPSNFALFFSYPF